MPRHRPSNSSRTAGTATTRRGSTSRGAVSGGRHGGGDLHTADFQTEITELLLNAAPDLTAAQILDVRQALLGLAEERGWVD